MTVSQGFPPVAREDARVLVLGSLPSQASLRERQYYAHPQNAFWKIMHVIAAATGSYASRCRSLREHGTAVWDVLASSVRPGSMDADIRTDTATPNDFRKFIENHRDIEKICFNGKTAERLFRRLVLPELGGAVPELAGLPSTSPAYASMTFDRKLEIWRSMLVLSSARN